MYVQGQAIIVGKVVFEYLAQFLGPVGEISRAGFFLLLHLAVC